MSTLWAILEGMLAGTAELAATMAAEVNTLEARVARLEATVEAHSAAIAAELGEEAEG